MEKTEAIWRSFFRHYAHDGELDGITGFGAGVRRPDEVIGVRRFITSHTD